MRPCFSPQKGPLPLRHYGLGLRAHTKKDDAGLRGEREPPHPGEHLLASLASIKGR